MVTQELKDKGIHCRGQGFNCYNCKDKNDCIEYVECEPIKFKQLNPTEKFIKELLELCKKHNKYVVGSGIADDMSMRILDNTNWDCKSEDEYIYFSDKTKKYEIEE
jgi:5'(3')-deoxyribonucleotidase